MTWSIEAVQQEVAALDDRALLVLRAEVEAALRRRFYPLQDDADDRDRFTLDAIRAELLQRFVPPVAQGVRNRNRKGKS